MYLLEGGPAGSNFNEFFASFPEILSPYGFPTPAVHPLKFHQTTHDIG
jgi:hypothetical protein